MTLAFLGFASLGLPDGAIGVAWPRIRESFDLPLDALGLLAASVSGYAFSSFCAGALLARIRIGALLALSCAATGARLLGYWAAPSGSAMVALGVVAGLGAGAIDVGINSFAATQLPPRMRHWLHAAYGLGTSAGPALMTRSLMSNAGWRGGYLVLGAIQLALAKGFAATMRRWPAPEAAAARAGAAEGLGGATRHALPPRGAVERGRVLPVPRHRGERGRLPLLAARERTPRIDGGRGDGRERVLGRPVRGARRVRLHAKPPAYGRDAPARDRGLRARGAAARVRPRRRGRSPARRCWDARRRRSSRR